MKTFLFSIGLMTGIMGLSTGAEAATHVLGAKKQTLTPASDTVNAGYYSSTTLSAVDTNLSTGNIKSGVTIFGKLGTYAAAGYALPDTGQTMHYSTAAGDDSDYQPAATQPSYTILNPVGISSVTVDNRTGLMWTTNPVDAGIVAVYTWENAIAICEALSYATFEDWRLPNIKELMSIVNYQNKTPAISTAYFLTVSGENYWSSTTNVGMSDGAWSVYFENGGVYGYGRTESHRVRCVRGGP